MEAQWGAVLRERGRIAREIHDTLAQGFVGISVQLELVARLLAGSREAAPKPAMEPVFEQLDQARALVRASLADARTSIWDLRSESRGAPAEDLPSRLSRSCTRIAGGSHGQGVPSGERDLSPGGRTRSKRNCCALARRRSPTPYAMPPPRRIDVQLIYEAARVSLRVEDDGRGF